MASIKSRKGKNGTTHTVRIRVKGCQPESKTFDRLTDAKAWANKTEAKIKSHRDFPERKAGKRTVKDAKNRYKKEGFKSKKGSEKKQSSQLDWWDKMIGHVKLAYLTPEIICDARSKLLERVTNRGTPISNATVNRYMSALSALLTATVSTWHWLSVNPVREIPQLPEGPGRKRFLSKDELLRLTKSCQESRNKRLLAIFLLAVATGLRKSEALLLKWTDIDFERRTAYIEDSKNSEPRTLPLEGPVWVELEKCYNNRRNDSDLVFPGKDPTKPMDFSGAWKGALKRAKIFNFVWHDNRHTTGSYLAMSGATIAEIAEILGHKTIAMAKRYAHHTVEHKRRKLTEMNRAHIPTDLVNAAMQHSDQAKADDV